MAHKMLAGVCMIVNNTSSAIDRAFELITYARGLAPDLGLTGQDVNFVLTIDEADDFIRTDMYMGSQAQKPGIQLERSLKRLIEKAPLIKFDVTATLLAIFLMLRRKLDAGLSDHLSRITASDIIYIEPDASYVGTEAFEALCLPNGTQLFLGPGELSNKNDFTSEKVRKMYADAARYPRSLLLDVTSPSVTAAGNIYTKAANLLCAHPHAVVIVVSGKEIMRRAGPEARGRVEMTQAERQAYAIKQSVTGKAKVFQTVLTQVDIDFPQTPIFVFGYSQMQRGISYRSSNRVPTHMVLQFGKAMSLCRLVQAAGRANGKQAEKLCENMGFPPGQAKVKLLTNNRDFDAIRNYPAFLEEIRRAMRNGELNLAQALELRFDGRFSAAGSRLIGARNADLKDATASLSFLAVTDEELKLHLPGESYLNTRLPGLMYPLLIILSEGAGVVEPEEGMTPKAIIEELDATYDEYKESMDRETLDEMSQMDDKSRAAKVRATLEEMNRSRIGVSPLVDCSERSPKRYAITDRGEVILELRARLDARSNSSSSPAPSLSRQTSAEAHRQRNARFAMEEDDDLFEDDDEVVESANNVEIAAGSERQEAGLAAVEPHFAFVHAFPRMVVMLGCLGREQPATFSRLFCPLIFLAANPSHYRTSQAMAFWSSRFSAWDDWVRKLRQSGVPQLRIDQDTTSCTTPLMYGQRDAYRIPHYTPTAQVDILALAGIAAEVDACALQTFHGVADPRAHLDDQLAANPSDVLDDDAAADPDDSGPAYRSMRSGPQPTGADVNAARTDIAETDDENDDSTWWAII